MHRDVILKNWLVNPTGKENAWVPVDLMQEHFNYWIKVRVINRFALISSDAYPYYRQSIGPTGVLRHGNG